LSWCDVIFEGVVEGVTLCDRGGRGSKSPEKKCDIIFEWPHSSDVHANFVTSVVSELHSYCPFYCQYMYTEQHCIALLAT